jgi:hypothetical protein
MRKTLNFIYVIGMAAGGAALAGGAFAGPFIKIDGVKGETTEQQAEPETASNKKAPKPKPQKGLLLPAIQKARDVAPSGGGGGGGSTPPPPPPPPPPPKGKPQTAVGDINGDGLDNPAPRAIITPRKTGDDKMNPQSQAPKRGTLSTRKAGEGQGQRSRRVGQIRTNE